MKPKWELGLGKLKKINKSYLLAAALIGILLLVIGIPTDQGAKGTEKKESSPPAVSGSTYDSYQKRVERQLEQMLSAMEGVGKAEVMITLKDEGESVVEKDMTRTEEHTTEQENQGSSRENSSISIQEESLYTKDGSQNEIPFVTKEKNPQVEGVLVVAEGGGNVQVVKNISEAILALFPIEAHKIKVVKMN